MSPFQWSSIQRIVFLNRAMNPRIARLQNQYAVSACLARTAKRSGGHIDWTTAVTGDQITNVHSANSYLGPGPLNTRQGMSTTRDRKPVKIVVTSSPSGI